MSTFLEALDFHVKHSAQFLKDRGIDDSVLADLRRDESKFKPTVGGGFYHESCTGNIPVLGKHSIVFPDNSFESGVVIGHGVLVLKYNEFKAAVYLGNNVKIGTKNFLGPGNQIKDGVSVANDNHLVGNVTVEPDTILGSFNIIPPGTTIAKEQIIRNRTIVDPQRGYTVVPLTAKGEVSTPDPKDIGGTLTTRESLSGRGPMRLETSLGDDGCGLEYTCGPRW